MSNFVTPKGEEEECVKHVQTDVSVGESTITIICSTYADRHFVVITQMDKIGTLISGRPVVGIDGAVHYEVNTLFGKRDDQLLHVYCRQIIEQIHKSGSSMPVLLAISLREEGRGVECFQAVLNSIREISTW